MTTSVSTQTNMVIEKNRKSFSYMRIFIYFFLILGSFMMMVPFIWLIRSSLMTNAQIFVFPPEWIPNPFQWSNYSEALTIVPFYRYFLNTMKIEVFTVIGVLLTSSLAAFSFARLKWPGKNIVFALLLSTLMLPYAVTLIPTFIFWKSIGMINTIVPLTVPAWLGGGAFNIFLLRQFFLTIPRELDEAAYMDGATPFTVYWKIILPLSKPALIVVGIFTFINVWNDFLGPLVYLGDNDSYTLALALASFKGMMNAQWGYLMAASAAITFPIVVLFFLAQKSFIQGITLTGLKG